MSKKWKSRSLFLWQENENWSFSASHCDKFSTTNNIHLHFPFPDWLSDTLIPDESFYATMARIRGTDPDTHQVLMDHKTDTLHGFCPRISLWRNKETCSGSVIRDICNFGFGDLYDLWQSDCWFANKFNLQVDANAAICHVQHLMELNKYQI